MATRTKSRPEPAPAAPVRARRRTARPKARAPRRVAVCAFCLDHLSVGEGGLVDSHGALACLVRSRDTDARRPLPHVASLALPTRRGGAPPLALPIFTVSFVPNDKPPTAKLADAEVVFTAAAGPLLAGLKIVGFTLWEATASQSRNITLPSDHWIVNGKRFSKVLMRPVAAYDPGRIEALKAMIFDQYDQWLASVPDAPEDAPAPAAKEPTP